MSYDQNYVNNMQDDEFDIPDDMSDEYQNNEYQEQGYQEQEYDNPEYQEQEDNEYIDNEVVTEDTNENNAVKISKPKGNKKHDKAKNNNTEQEQVEKVLYFITDRPTPGLLSYIRDCGLNVDSIHDKIETVRDIMIMQMVPTRIVVIDSGTGKFITPTIRKELIDMIGMADEDTEFTIFYTDSIIKSDTIEEIGKDYKNIEWFRYSGTTHCIATMLSHKEKYRITSSHKKYAESKVSEADILNMMGEPTPGRKEEKPSRIGIDPYTVAKYNEDESYGKIIAFNIKL